MPGGPETDYKKQEESSGGVYVGSHGGADKPAQSLAAAWEKALVDSGMHGGWSSCIGSCLYRNLAETCRAETVPAGLEVLPDLRAG